jgi:hypothetical protein
MPYIPYNNTCSSSGPIDAANPPPWGTGTPNTGNFTTLTSQSINGTINAAAYAGADACVKINNAAIANPGQRIDATAITGLQSCSINPWANITGNMWLYLNPNVVLVTTAQWVMPSAYSIIVDGGTRGIRTGQPTGASIRAASTFPLNTPVVREGSGSTSFGQRLENIVIDCNNVAGGIGLYSTDIQEQSGIEHFEILNCLGGGILMDGSGAVGTGPYWAENYIIDDGEIYTFSGASASTYGVKILSSHSTVNGPRFIRNVTTSGYSGNNMGAGFIFDGVTTHIYDLNAQYATTGYQLGGTNGVMNFIGQNLQCEAIATTCVWIKNPSPNYTSGLYLYGILNGGFVTPTTLEDDTYSSQKFTDYYIGSYWVDNGNQFRISTASAPITIPSTLPGLSLTNLSDYEQSFALNSGKTAQQGDAILFQDRGTNKWNIEYTKTSQDLNFYDYTNTVPRLTLDPINGMSYLNSVKTQPVYINDSVNAGTGGVTVCSGGSAPACNLTLGATGDITAQHTNARLGFQFNGVPGLSNNITFNTTAGACQLTFQGGILTSASGAGCTVALRQEVEPKVVVSAGAVITSSPTPIDYKTRETYPPPAPKKQAKPALK